MYRVDFTRRANRQLRSLPKDIATRIGRRIHALAGDPRPRGSLKLADAEVALYRIRVGDYRVIYEIRDDVLVVVIGSSRQARRGHVSRPLPLARPR